MRLTHTAAILFFAGLANAGTITTFTNRATFNGAVGATTIENFTDTGHFPITTGILNSFTNLVVANGSPITPGLIQPGVTYSTPIGTGNFFNIDTGGGFTGGFLDSLGLSQSLTVTFTGPVRAFGFDTNALIPGLNIGISFSSSPGFVSNFNFITGPQFFGYQSDAQDIASVLISSTSGSFGFALDNFTFTEPGVSGVPEPSTVSMIGAAMAATALHLRRKAKR